VKDAQMKCSKVLMQFSNDGAYFGIYDIQDKQLSIYDSSSITRCFYELEKANPLFKIDLEKIFDVG